MVRGSATHLRLLPPPADRSVRSTPVEDERRLQAAHARVSLHAVRTVMRTVDDPLRSMVIEHLSTGGKALRSLVTLRAAAALGCDPEGVVGVAAACELLHNATLVHDDLQDGDRVRRGEPSVWVRHGMAQAINVGDVLLMLPNLALQDSHLDPATCWYVSTAFARRSAQTASGQSLELSLLEECPTDREAYLHAARGKSGSFFALPIEVAALCAGLPPELARRLGDDAADLGVLFQVRDDILDLFGDKGRGAAGNDLREGKISALTVAHLELYPEERPMLEATLRRSRQDTTDEEVAHWTTQFWDRGALSVVRDWAKELLRGLEEAPTLRDEPGIHRLITKTAHALYAPLLEVGAR